MSGGGGLFLVLVDQPILDKGGGRLSVGARALALDVDGDGLVLLEAGGQVGLLGRGGRLGHAERGHVAVGVRVLDGRRLVGLELAEVDVLDEVGCISRERQLLSLY